LIEHISTIASNKLSQYENMPEEDVMKYSIKFLLTNFLTILLIVSVGLAIERFYEVFLVAFSFALLRRFIGGYHIKSSELCVFASVALVTVLTLIGVSITEYSVFINIGSLLLVILYAPHNIDDTTLVNKKYFFLFKLIGFFLISINFYINNIYVSIGFFAEALTIIHFKGGEK
jgi:accessory gene regulator B